MELRLNPEIRLQAYAIVLVADRPTLTITAASANTGDTPWGPPEQLIGTSMRNHFLPATLANILESAQGTEPGVVKPSEDEPFVAQTQQLVVHAFADELVLEMEPTRSWPHPDDYSARLNNFTRQLEDAPTINILMQRLCTGIRHHFGYDRIIALQFDQHHNGLVTHEARADDMPSYLDVHFTREDVTADTRYNQLVETVHNFADVSTELCGLVGSYGPAGREMLRRHLGCREPNENFVDFLRDNGLRCNGYLSLVVGSELFGSLYFHRRSPLYVDYQMRSFLSVVGRVAQQKLAYHLYSRTLRLQQAANVVRDRLQEHIVNSDTLAEGLTGNGTSLIDLLEDTHGAAICSDETLTLFGITPHEKDVDAIVAYMKTEHGNEKFYHTDRLGTLFPPAADYLHLAAGFLFLPLDLKANQWIVWFKPEVVQTITYGSTAAAAEEEDTRRRFYVHDATRHDHSLPWTADETGTALALQAFILNVVAQRYARTKHSNELLREAYEDLEAFSYTVGHDLRAPLRGIASFAEILEEDFAAALGEEGVNHVRTIRQNAKRMRAFMSNLLTLSRVDRKSIIVNELSVADLVNRVLADRATTKARSFECTVGDDLPPIRGDHNHLVTVFTNLLSNAVKYSSGQEAPRIEVGHTGDYIDGHPVFFVADNGIGIPPDQQECVFELFVRSPNAESFRGTGIGLALVERIIRFHDGTIWIESQEGTGTRFLFYTGV